MVTVHMRGSMRVSLECVLARLQLCRHWLSRMIHFHSHSRERSDDTTIKGKYAINWLVARIIQDRRKSYIQSWPKNNVLGCVIPPVGAVAGSRNLGHTFFTNSVVEME